MSRDGILEAGGWTLACWAAGYVAAVFAEIALGGRIAALEPAFAALAAVLVVGAGALHLRRRPPAIVDLGPAVLAAAVSALAWMTLRQVATHLVVSADLVSFAESPFVADIVKLRAGEPIYSDPRDHNGYPYPPGTQLLTYALASLFGGGESVPVLRMVQFGFVLAAAGVATSICSRLARRDGAWTHAAWPAVWFPFLLLLSVEPRFNGYNISLHNDGLALLVSMLAYRLAISRRSGWGALVSMALLPAAGFLVKQSLLIWAAAFVFVELFSRGGSWRRAMLVGAASAALALATIGVSLGLFGEHFGFWIFAALGQKSVSIARSVEHFLEAGVFFAIGSVGGWIVCDRGEDRDRLVGWSLWLGLFLAEAYTSGLGFVMNHLGPGVVLAGCWFLAAVARNWVALTSGAGPLTGVAGQLAGVAAFVAFVGGLGVVWNPRQAAPRDVERYVREIESEFAGLPVSKVLLDTGSWMYLRSGVVMKDRSAPVSVHLGANQASIAPELFADTVSRIRAREYEKILARQIDGPGTWYDFQSRGSGIREAILESYREVRRIDPVAGVSRWWPPHLLAEIVVLEPKPPSEGPPDAS